MRSRKGTLLLSLVDEVSVLVLVYGLIILCDPLMITQVIYPLVWGVGLENVV